MANEFLLRLKKEGLITLETIYIDGTKIEANANRYTFVWRDTLNYHLVGLLDTIDSLYTRYKKFMLYAIGRNINKYHRFLEIRIPRQKCSQKACISARYYYFLMIRSEIGINRFPLFMFCYMSAGNFIGDMRC